jgi:hypothetical protein
VSVAKATFAQTTGQILAGEQAYESLVGDCLDLGLAYALVARLAMMSRRSSTRGRLTELGRPDQRKELATRVLMPLIIVGQAALSSWLVARVGGVSILIAVVQVALASAFWQMIHDSPEESRFQPLGVILPMLLLFGFIAALTIDIQSSFLPVVTWRVFMGK